MCPRCGADYVPFGEECCELIDWQVQLVRVVIRRPTYRRGCRCPVRGVLAAPPAPKPIGKGRFTSRFLARLLVEKFVHGRPTHRIAAALAHDGLDLADGTLAGVLAACSDLLAPLADKISERNAAAAHLHMDETRWQVFAAVEGKDSHRWWCWVFARPGHHRVHHRPVAVAEGPHHPARCRPRPGHRRVARCAARRAAAAAVLGLLHRLPVVGPRGRGGQPVVLEPHPPLLRPRRGRPPRPAGVDPGLAGADRRALPRPFRAGRRAYRAARSGPRPPHSSTPPCR